MMASTSGCYGDQLQHLRDRVACLAAGTVDGIVAAPSRRQLLVDRRLQIVGQLEQHEVAVAGDRIGGHDAPAAGGRQHDGVRTLRQRLRGERGGRLERLLDVGGACDAGGPARAVEDLVVGGQRAGVARRGMRAALGRPALDQHERLARRRPRRGGPSVPGRR